MALEQAEPHRDALEGVRLDRVGGLQPTAAGRDLLEGAAQLLAALGELEQRVRAPVTPPAKIRLVCECYTAYHWLPSALSALRATLPELRISLAIEHTLDPVPALESGAIDVALLTTSKLPRGGLEEAPLFSDEIDLVLAGSHPLAARKTLTADDLRDATLLSPNVPPATAKAFLGHVFGPRPPATLRFQFLPLTEAILDLARAGMGVAVMSDWIAGPHLGKGDLVTRRLATGPMRRPWRIAWRPEARDAAERLHGVVGTFTPRRTDGTTRPSAASSATTAARRSARSPR